MRRNFAALVAVFTILAAVPAFSHEGFEPPGEEMQSLTGSIALPTRFIDGEQGWPGLVRRVYNGSAASNGVIGYVFDVYRETWGGAFVIGDVTDRTGEGDLDVFFYDEFGDFGGQAAPTTTGEYADKHAGGEVGFVPPGTRKAVVFTRNAVDASFSYRGFAPPVIRLSQPELDLTVPAGATVVWLNNTDDYSFVRHVPVDGEPLFNSSPVAGTGIRVGDTYSFLFEQTGTFAYTTSGGNGTITVTDGPGIGPPTG